MLVTNERIWKEIWLGLDPIMTIVGKENIYHSEMNDGIDIRNNIDKCESSSSSENRIS